MSTIVRKLWNRSNYIRKHAQNSSFFIIIIFFFSLQVDCFILPMTSRRWPSDTQWKGSTQTGRSCLGRSSWLRSRKYRPRTASTRQKEVSQWLTLSPLQSSIATPVRRGGRVGFARSFRSDNPTHPSPPVKGQDEITPRRRGMISVNLKLRLI